MHNNAHAVILVARLGVVANDSLHFRSILQAHSEGAQSLQLMNSPALRSFAFRPLPGTSGIVVRASHWGDGRKCRRQTRFDSSAIDAGGLRAEPKSIDRSVGR